MILGAETYQRVESRTNYRNAQSKVSKTDLLWLLLLIKDLVSSSPWQQGSLFGKRT